MAFLMWLKQCSRGLLRKGCEVKMQQDTSRHKLQEKPSQFDNDFMEVYVLNMKLKWYFKSFFNQKWPHKNADLNYELLQQNTKFRETVPLKIIKYSYAVNMITVIYFTFCKYILFLSSIHLTCYVICSCI